MIEIEILENRLLEDYEWQQNVRMLNIINDSYYIIPDNIDVNNLKIDDIKQVERTVLLDIYCEAEYEDRKNWLNEEGEFDKKLLIAKKYTILFKVGEMQFYNDIYAIHHDIFNRAMVDRMFQKEDICF